MKVETLGRWVYIAGKFSTVGGLTRRGLARIDGYQGYLDRSSDLNLQLPSTVSVTALKIHNGNLFFSGEFHQVMSRVREKAAAVDIQGPSLLTWQPVLDRPALDFEVFSPSGTMIAGGQFTSVNGDSSRKYLTAISLTSGSNLNWNNLYPSQPVHDLTVVNGSELLVSGEFLFINSVPRGRVARFNSSGPLPSVNHPSMDSDVYASVCLPSLVRRRGISVLSLSSGNLAW